MEHHLLKENTVVGTGHSMRNENCCFYKVTRSHEAIAKFQGIQYSGAAAETPSIQRLKDAKPLANHKTCLVLLTCHKI